MITNGSVTPDQHKIQNSSLFQYLMNSTAGLMSLFSEMTHLQLTLLKKR